LISLIQRVSQARVEVAGVTIGQIGHGLLVLVCAEHGDSQAEADKLLAKLLKLRIFSDEAGKMNRSVQDVKGGLPTPRAAIARASRAPLRPTTAAACTPISWRRPGWPIRTWPAANSPPICRCTWSTTGR
jgi:D-tyrosyl-tRNA(Tyr) deacylase